MALAATILPAAADAGCPAGRPLLAHGLSLDGVDATSSWRRTGLPFLKRLRKLGFDHVRLPVRAEDLIAEFASPRRTKLAVDHVRADVKRLTGLGFKVALDMHGGAKLDGLLVSDPERAKADVLQAWKRLAPVVNSAPAGRVFAEVLNEPHLEGSEWVAVQEALVAGMRELMPSVTFILNAGGAQRVEAQLTMVPSADPNVIWSVHYYDPMAFTHQGAGFMTGSPIADLHSVPFPLRGDDPRIQALAAELRSEGKVAAADYLESARSYVFDANSVRQDLASLQGWTEATGQRVIIGEFGVLRDAAPVADRNEWLATLTRSAHAACLGWTHWDATGGFGIIDPVTRKIDRATVDALLPRG